MARRLLTRDQLADLAHEKGYRVTATFLNLLEEVQQNGFQAGADMRTAVLRAPIRKPIRSRRRAPPAAIARQDPREGMDALLDKLRVPPKRK